jgi:hypothetical protein
VQGRGNVQEIELQCDALAFQGCRLQLSYYFSDEVGSRAWVHKSIYANAGTKSSPKRSECENVKGLKCHVPRKSDPNRGPGSMQIGKTI